MALQELITTSKHSIESKSLALILDEKDHLRHFRKEFSIPSLKKDLSDIIDEESSEIVYLCGNSLGLMPIHTRTLLNQELDVWSSKGVDGHFSHDFDRPWGEFPTLKMLIFLVSIDDHVIKGSAQLVGAKDNEIAILNSLSVNLHLLLVSFYVPTPKRHKILIEVKN